MISMFVCISFVFLRYYSVTPSEQLLGISWATAPSQRGEVLFIHLFSLLFHVIFFFCWASFLPSFFFSFIHPLFLTFHGFFSFHSSFFFLFHILICIFFLSFPVYHKAVIAAGGTQRGGAAGLESLTPPTPPHPPSARHDSSSPTLAPFINFLLPSSAPFTAFFISTSNHFCFFLCSVLPSPVSVPLLFLPQQAVSLHQRRQCLSGVSRPSSCVATLFLFPLLAALVTSMVPSGWFFLYTPAFSPPLLCLVVFFLCSGGELLLVAREAWCGLTIDLVGECKYGRCLNFVYSLE